MTVLSSDSKKAERLCCIFPGSVLEIQKEINGIFEEEINVLFKSENMKKVFKNINICAICVKLISSGNLYTAQMN